MSPRDGSIRAGRNAANPSSQARSPLCPSSMVRRRRRHRQFSLPSHVHGTPCRTQTSLWLLPRAVKEHPGCQGSKQGSKPWIGFTVLTGYHYLCGFLGANEDLQAWLKDKASTWEHAVDELAGIAPKYPRTAYTGLQKSLQNGWQFVQRVKPGIGDHLFHGVEVALATKFLPDLFGESIDDHGDPRHILASLPVKHAGLAIPNPTDSASSCYEASTLVCSHLTAAVRGVVSFCYVTHQEGR
jgi:hypothetical protein